MFTVVIPVFNKRNYVLNTLRTVLNQTYSCFEIIIVDDGSTDQSLEAITEAISDSRIKIIRQSNQGVSAARNRGVKESSNPYIAFLDADDEWHPSYLEKAHECIQQFPNTGMLCFAGLVKNSSGTIGNRTALKYQEQIVAVNYFENPHVFGHTSATIVKREVFNRTSGFPVGMKRNEDFALFYSIALITPVVYCGFPLSTYVGGVEGQATSTPSEQVSEYVIQRYNHVFESFLQTDQSNQLYLIFTKYELRHTFLMFLINQEPQNLQKFLNQLHPELLKHFSSMEKKLYTKVYLKKISIYFIYMTKIRWRLRRFPRTGEGQMDR
ncbi:glycosyltransferase family A protein [Coraliomargarita sp. SDUM461004]|uniref:Glycosyltransferase family A protein n=1 Tax=Thalassobacterium sedimentorum TaxID=3041258 RepID=A0ABU1AQQ1_9BACT|nr:glycosyltransferase family A protein [Coraliomargarita sp. SDUM461004]MDQ8195938.1 glycosyltransferase family A protein [Coraliomargarita sp. SDUM461004]